LLQTLSLRLWRLAFTAVESNNNFLLGDRMLFKYLHRLAHRLQARNRLRCTLCGDLIQTVGSR